MMMWILLILLALAAVVFAVAPCLGDKALRAPFQNRNCAHRGLFTQDQSVPENSIPAFEAAARAGYGIELDVQFTQDKRLVVFHDDTVDRMTSAKGLVQDMPYAAFANLTLAGTNVHPPLFGDMLRAVTAATTTAVVTTVAATASAAATADLSTASVAETIAGKEATADVNAQENKVPQSAARPYEGRCFPRQQGRLW